jgi:hypothetical protein
VVSTNLIPSLVTAENLPNKGHRGGAEYAEK